MTEALETIKSYIPEEYFTFLQNSSFYISLGLIAAFVVFALFGYKLFKIELAIIGAGAFGLLGFWYLAPLIVNALGEKVPENVNIYVITGLACAVIGAVLVILIHKLAIFVGGAAVGAAAGWGICIAVGMYYTDSEFINSMAGHIVFAAVGGILLGVLFLFLFKPIYIIVTSVGGMTVVGYLVASTVMSIQSPVVVGISMAVGGVLGIFAAVYQFKSNRDSEYRYK